MMEVGLGILGLDPEIFWKMTEPEFKAAIEGFQERHGGKKEPQGMTGDRLKELMADYPDA